jgi:hypothetical protein
MIGGRNSRPRKIITRAGTPMANARPFRKLLSTTFGTRILIARKG